MESSKGISRRRFLMTAATGVAALPVIQSIKISQAEAADACAAGTVKESDPQAKALGYVVDAKKVDKVKYKDKFKEGQNCGNCLFFKSTKTGDDRTKENAPCDPIFMKKCVAGAGWCGSWIAGPTFKA